MTRERTKETSREEEKTVVVEYCIHGGDVRIVKVKKGATTQEVLDEIQKENPGIDLKTATIMLNGKQLEIGEDGKLKENPVITENSVLLILRKFKGGPTSYTLLDYILDRIEELTFFNLD